MTAVGGLLGKSWRRSDLECSEMVMNAVGFGDGATEADGVELDGSRVATERI